MTGVHFTYPNPRPLLVIEFAGSRKLGRCYWSTTYRITATERLSAEKLRKIRDAGLLGMGQEFYIRSKTGGHEDPAGMDELPCVVVDAISGKPTVLNAIRDDGTIAEPIRRPFYVYECEDRCDSGD